MSRLAPIVVLATCFGTAPLCADEAIHWAYVPPRRPALPTIRQASWPRNPIDNFTLARMEAAGISPSAPADASTIVRRMTLDLGGLPPSQVELDDYISDRSIDAADRLATRLLASPRFGERLAQHWLDLARYADTHGYLIDAHRDMWRWRDWLIDALNQDMPFDQFTIEQLAGDLLPNATTSQRIASGFNRNHMVNYENGAIPEEYRVDYVADRVSTTATVWLGQTLECARCHDHKYDPFSMRDFYQLFAFFNNVAEEGLDGNQGNAAPLLAAPPPEQQRRMNALNEQITRLGQVLEARRSTCTEAIATWEASLQAHRPVTLPPLDAAVQLACDTITDQTTPCTGTLVPALAVASICGNATLAPGRLGKALLLDGQTHVVLGKTDLGPTANGLSLAAWLFPTTADPMAIASWAASDGKQQFDLQLDGGRIEVHLQRRAGTDSIHVRGKCVLALRRWQHVTVTWDGETTAEGLHIYVNGQPVEIEVLQRRLLRALDRKGTWFVGGTVQGAGFRGLIDDFRLFGRELLAVEASLLGSGRPIDEVLATPRAQRTRQQRDLLREFYLSTYDVEFRRLSDELAAARRQLADEHATAPTTMVMQELAAPRETFVLLGGAFDKPGERVMPSTPAVLPRFPADAPRNRLGLARWIVNPANPLPARVAVNRLWQHFFGVGLVTTPEDFGRRGEPPSHPELLDWLAVEFVESGWDVKHMVRLVVGSATYLQASRARPELMAADPNNRLLARAPRVRLDAETIRDSALSVSGLFDNRLGGPNVFPYQPGGLWEEISYDPAEFTAQTYRQSQGRDLYRRSLYTFWKRTLPPPALVIFDAPTREKCTVGRMRTNTPLQALVLMNDPTYVEAARKLAERMLVEGGQTREARVATAFRWVTSRWPDAEESAALVALYEKQLVRFEKDSQAAAKLLAVGESSRDQQLAIAELAAWTTVANVLLSLDEVITRN